MNEPRATNWCHECQRLAGQLKQAEAELDAARAKLGVVSELWSKKTNYDADPDGAYGPGVSLRRDHADMIDAALASEPEIVAVDDSSPMRDGKRHIIEDTLYDFTFRAIIVRRAE